eukprot:Platyproteum_vivax@DN3479_c0_g1_i1.p1
MESSSVKSEPKIDHESEIDRLLEVERDTLAQGAPSWQARAVIVHREMSLMLESYFFRIPPDTNVLKDYLSVVKEPSDLETVAGKLRDDAYLDIDGFIYDMILIGVNAMQYNYVGSRVWRDGFVFAKTFHDKIPRLKDPFLWQLLKIHNLNMVPMDGMSIVDSVVSCVRLRHINRIKGHKRVIYKPEQPKPRKRPTVKKAPTPAPKRQLVTPKPKSLPKLNENEVLRQLMQRRQQQQALEHAIEMSHHSQTRSSMSSSSDSPERGFDPHGAQYQDPMGEPPGPEYSGGGYTSPQPDPHGGHFAAMGGGKTPAQHAGGKISPTQGGGKTPGVAAIAMRLGALDSSSSSASSSDSE